MDQNSETLETEERTSVGRRTLLKGAAWSVPAVLVVGATPAFAQTGVTQYADLFGSTSIILTRGTSNQSSRISFSWTLNNPTSNPQITGLSVTIGTLATISITPTPAPISGGGNQTFDFVTDEGNSSDALANFTINVNYTIGTQSKSHTWTVSAESVNTTKTVTLTGGVAGGTYA